MRIGQFMAPPDGRRGLAAVTAGTLFLISWVPAQVRPGAGPWDASRFGNHRVVLRVTAKADAVWAHIEWRRRDPDPQNRNLIVVDAATGRRITNVCRARISREAGDIVFQPATSPGDYYVYYLPYVSSGRQNYPTVVYPVPEETAEPGWLAAHRLAPAQAAEHAWTTLPRAEVVEIQSIAPFHSFQPMEVIATEDETRKLLARHPSASYLLFAEDRSNPTRMTEDLPLKWIESGAERPFHGQAARGEFFSFQVGLWAISGDIEVAGFSFEGLKSAGTAAIPVKALRCFNTSGVDPHGNEFKKQVRVTKGKVRALWFGLQVPPGARPGNYEGMLAIIPGNAETRSIPLRIAVSDEVAADAGDGEPARLSRLRWLDSTLALDDEDVPAPFAPVTVKGSTLGCLGRSITLDNTGLPSSIRSFFAPEVTHLTAPGRELLTGPVTLAVESYLGKILSWNPSGVRWLPQETGKASWVAHSSADPFEMFCRGELDFDGTIEYAVTIRASRAALVNDIRLELPVAGDAARYMMGMGWKGGRRPAELRWKWDPKKNQDSLWIGDVNAGLQLSLKDENYVRPLNTNFYLLKPLNMPPSWFNEGKGGCDVVEKAGQAVLLRAYSGARTIGTGDELHFNFRLAITPFKPIDTRGQWSARYYHQYKPVEEIAATGANTVNVHHANEINPWINYPFLRPRQMKAYVDAAHAKGLKVKIYYTVRELSNRAAELFVLRSLDDPVFLDGPGGGFSWLQEHLGSNYIGGWLVPDLEDAAIVTSGVSRWHNYYVEGLQWLAQNVGIDGLYIDDVAFDRTTMKRVRRILDRNRPGALIDLHSANQFNVRDGFANSANLYLEHFPYIDRLWFGEYFDYDAPPDFWLVELSGIPYGVMGEMLQDGGNPWRGMLYGMTSRLPYSGDPRPLWKLWDEFGIQDSRMVGYWSPGCPVRTQQPDVLASAYVRNDRTLIALASWATETSRCRLSFDWKALGLDPQNCHLRAPAIAGFQEAAAFGPDEEIPVPPRKGWLLILGPK